MSGAEHKIVNNHLIIGLGGTGGKILRELRKTLAAGAKSDSDINFEFLYVDSSSELMRGDDPRWRVLGKSVQLAKSQQLLIEGAGLTELLANIDAYPNIAPWIGPLEIIRNIARATIDSAQGGQRRKFGRFLFACSARKFVSSLAGRVEALRRRKNSSLVTFHLCVGLAGGTGGGGIVDVVAQIRKAYPEPEDFRILIYALLPDRHPKANWDYGNYHANGYAALIELNALAVGAYRPVDLCGSGQRMELPSITFNGCYVFFNENESGVFADVESDIPGIVADFIYQKTLGLHWEALSGAENSENGNKDDEFSVDGSRAERSKRFLSFGIKRLVVPEEEIKEYLTYNFAEQAVRQFMYNHWIDGAGFSGEPAPADFHSEVARQETQNRWFLSDAHLTLSIGILPADAGNVRWKKIPEYWNSVIPQHKQDIQATVSKKQNWLDELKKRCEQIFDDVYRGSGGVKQFYGIKLKSKTDIARYIRATVEQELFGEWRTGHRSLSDSSRILGALNGLVEEKLGKVDERLTRLRAQEEEVSARVSGVAQQWAGMNWMTEMLGKGQKLFNSAGEYLTQLYVYRTLTEGWAFAKKLLEELHQQLLDLRNEVDRLSGTLGEASREFERQINGRLTDRLDDPHGHKLRVYNQQAVRAFNQRLVADESIQKQQTDRVRISLVKRLGESDLSFTALNRKVDALAVRNLIEEISGENVVSFHSLLAAEQKRVFNVNIIEKLYEDYGSNDDALTGFVTQSIVRSGIYMTFDEQEERKQGFGTDENDKHIKTAGVFLPECKECPEFAVKLERLFIDNMGAFAFDLLKEGARNNEITIIRVDNLFPLRFIKPLKFLKEKYDARRAVSEDNKYLLHGEGDGSGWPPLLIPSRADIAAEKLHYLVLARALGMILDRRNVATGKMETVFPFLERKTPQEEVLGKTFIDGVKNLDAVVLRRIEQSVAAVVISNDYKQEDRRLELYDDVLRVIDEVKAACGENLQDETYKQFAATTEPIMNLLQLENQASEFRLNRQSARK